MKAGKMSSGLLLQMHRLGCGLDEEQLAILLRSRFKMRGMTAERVRRMESGAEVISVFDAPYFEQLLKARELTITVAKEQGIRRVPTGVLMRVARLHYGWTQGEMAKRAGYAHSNFVSMIEGGTSKVPRDLGPKLDSIFRLKMPLFARRALEDHAAEAAAAVLPPRTV